MPWNNKAPISPANTWTEHELPGDPAVQADAYYGVQTTCGLENFKILNAIERACKEIIDRKLHDEFRLDVFHGGAGASTNMNTNEVIANRHFDEY